MAVRLIGQRIIIRTDDIWKRGYLVGVDAPTDRIWVKHTKYGRVKVMRGIWRVHMNSLFSANSGLPAPLYAAKIPVIPTNPRRGSQMATRVTRSKTKAAGTKKPPAKTAAAAKPSANGDAPRRKDKLAHLSEAQRKKAAAIIFRMRKEGKGWDAVMEELEDKNMSIPGSMTGRRLLRDYGPDDAESVIRERVANTDGAAKKKATSTKVKAKAKVADEEEEEEEEAPRPRRKVRVKRGTGKKSNPS